MYMKYTIKSTEDKRYFKDTNRIHWVYLHGYMDSIWDYDICLFVGKSLPTIDKVVNDEKITFIKKGIYKCNLIGKGNKKHYCHAFIWNTGINTKGLIVSCCDREAYAYALKSFNENKNHL